MIPGPAARCKHCSVRRRHRYAAAELRLHALRTYAGVRMRPRHHRRRASLHRREHQDLRFAHAVDQTVMRPALALAVLPEGHRRRADVCLHTFAVPQHGADRADAARRAGDDRTSTSASRRSRRRGLDTGDGSRDRARPGHDAHAAEMPAGRRSLETVVEVDHVAGRRRHVAITHEIGRAALQTGQPDRCGDSVLWSRARIRRRRC